jgi:hypothetical protein
VPIAYIWTVRHASVWIAAVRGRIGTIRANANLDCADYAASMVRSGVPSGVSSGAPSVAGSKAAAQPPAATQGVTFHEVLSELNPLQYIPVVGTIYRSITGDTIPEPVRVIGSMIVSGLIGGPIGLALSIGALSVEKATGLDPEVIGHGMLASIGIGQAAPPVAVAGVAGAPVAGAPVAGAPVAGTPVVGTPVAGAPVAAPTPTGAATDQAGPDQATWSPTQLAAYGVTAGADGTLHHGDLSGSDVLNALELAYLGPVQAAAGTTVLAAAAPAA